MRFPRLAATVALLGAARAGGAQNLASPHGSVSQLVDSTTITIEYYRPAVRGREIFGKLVRWGELWTPGANWATTIEVDHDVRLEGQALPRGKYSLWMIPQRDVWTLVVSRTARRFHLQRPTGDDELFRVPLRPQAGAATERLTFTFPEVTQHATTLAFAWATTQVPMHIDVEPARALAGAAHPWASYAGRYELRFTDDDSASTRPIPFEVVVAGGALRVRTTPDAVPDGIDPEYDLVPDGGDTFHERKYVRGKLLGDEPNALVIFHLDGDRAAWLELHDAARGLRFARATRRAP